MVCPENRMNLYIRTNTQVRPYEKTPRLSSTDTPLKEENLAYPSPTSHLHIYSGIHPSIRGNFYLPALHSIKYQFIVVHPAKIPRTTKSLLKWSNTITTVMTLENPSKIYKRSILLQFNYLYPNIDILL